MTPVGVSLFDTLRFQVLFALILVANTFDDGKIGWLGVFLRALHPRTVSLVLLRCVYKRRTRELRCILQGDSRDREAPFRRLGTPHDYNANSYASKQNRIEFT